MEITSDILINNGFIRRDKYINDTEYRYEIYITNQNCKKYFISIYDYNSQVYKWNVIINNGVNYLPIDSKRLSTIEEFNEYIKLLGIYNFILE